MEINSIPIDNDYIYWLLFAHDQIILAEELSETRDRIYYEILVDMYKANRLKINNKTEYLVTEGEAGNLQMQEK